jgi:lipopolysaccharide transport system ATP-binding protein
LAFAVAAHLEPEVLIIDEVLAVGDAEFQKKCLGKMGEVSKSGRTVLFVSHDLEAVTKLCTKSVVLHKGRMEFFDISCKATEFYHNLSKTSDTSGSFYNPEGQIFFEKITIPNRIINTGDDLELDIEILQKHLQKNIVLNVNITDHMGNLIAHMINYDDNHQTIQSKTIRATINEINLPIGIYNLSFWAGLDSSTPIEYLPNILSFEIKSLGNYIKRKSNVPSNVRMILRSKWE